MIDFDKYNTKDLEKLITDLQLLRKQTFSMSVDFVINKVIQKTQHIVNVRRKK